MPEENSEHSRSARERLESWEAQVGVLIRKQREAAGLSQSALAERLTRMGFSARQTMIAKIESGARPLRLSEFVGIAEALGVPWQTLLLAMENYGKFSGTDAIGRLQQRVDSAELLAEDTLRDALSRLEDYARQAGNARAAEQLIGKLSVNDPQKLALEIHIILEGEDAAPAS